VPDVLLFTEGHGEPLDAGGGIERTKIDKIYSEISCNTSTRLAVER
jgi:hypothetical protein